MRISVVFLFIGISVLLYIPCPKGYAQQNATINFHSTRISVSAGMGVNYHDAPDIVNTINGNSIVAQRVGDFKSGVEFFGAVSTPISRDWAVKGEYVYLFASYSQATGFGTVEFSYAVHMPSVIVQYILVESAFYNLKAGAGGGYHFGLYDEKYFSSDYSGQGLGTLLELEGNTALGDDLFAHLGVQTRWEFIGSLKSSNGTSPLRAVSTTLKFFSLGARLGMSYYF